MANDLVNEVNHSPVAMPPILAGQFTPETQERVERFYFSVAAIFETWVKRRQSRHTRRAYREDVMAFARFVGIAWPEQCASLLKISITDVQDFRESMTASDAAPKTINRRISSLSSFYKYLALRRNLTEWPFHAAFRQATNSVLVAAMRCAFNSR